MSVKRPLTMEEFCGIYGVGKKNSGDYGERFLDVIRGFVEQEASADVGETGRSIADQEASADTGETGRSIVEQETSADTGGMRLRFPGQPVSAAIG